MHKNNLNMKVLAIIPARYSSTRFPGKPLADICGRPMLWWVYNQVIKASKITKVIVATDDYRIKEVCKKAISQVYGIGI